MSVDMTLCKEVVSKSDWCAISIAKILFFPCRHRVFIFLFCVNFFFIIPCI